MSKVSDFGKASLKVGNAIEEIGKTDEMLAVIGVIMLLGVIVSAYGSLWQGNLARKQYNEECTPGSIKENEIKNSKIILYLILAAITGGFIIYFILKIKSKNNASNPKFTLA